MSSANPQSPLADILGRIALAAKAVGRDPAEVSLIAVSKTQPLGGDPSRFCARDSGVLVKIGCRKRKAGGPNAAKASICT